MKMKIVPTMCWLLMSGAAWAQPVVDANYDAVYGAAKSRVGFDAAALENNFSAPENASRYAAYDIFLANGTDRLFGYLKADRNTGLQFANLYFDLDFRTRSGSDLGFEIGQNGVNAFIPSTGERTALSSADFSTAFSPDGTAIEFSLSNALFSSRISGLTTYNPAQTFPGPGEDVRLNLSQSFGYSVAGGTSYGNNRLGVTAVGASIVAAVPEPDTWAMMIIGFGVAGAGLRRRRTKVTTRAAFA